MPQPSGHALNLLFIIRLWHYDATMTKIYHHIAKGIESYYQSEHAESIRQFDQVVEHLPSKFPTLEKYKPLRHALSHFGPV